MAWSSCSKCSHELDEPTPSQVINNDYLCPSCGHNNYPNKSLAEIVLELCDRVAALEQDDLSTVVLASSVELSLLPNEARWLKTLMQNPVYSNESAEDADYRAAIFNKIDWNHG